ncbi:HNH endonuclease [Pseudomonas sp. CG7]|uniref:HNH endonuclease n=1 Tax=Pseudomonas sp. CG7 TaxID=191007 RepID=UPI002033D9EC|nr:HNH endonuclease signature motif containing protein [Pseudomonas sp. CG7]MCM2459177.1 HNH endonuclease [Pseudomonas sp. CG7]
MMRLTAPDYTFEQVLDTCLLGITGNAAFKLSIEGAKASLIVEGELYASSSREGNLYSIAPIDLSIDLNPIVLSDLNKSDFIKLYETYFVPEEKPAREIYNKLLNAAKESCPFCGGIGTPRNLDHFLPKSHFPQYSVLPANLVPSCRDCNMDGKAAVFAIQAEHQIIQPYLDHERFFNEQWIFARYEEEGGGEPGQFEYFVNPPSDWSETDKRRVERHFEDFNLGHRYSVKAAQILGTVMAQVASLQRIGLNNQVISETILAPGVSTAQFSNHWQCGLYQALMRHFEE